MKKVAFIITVYKNDNPCFFEESVSSIINQTYGFENINIYLGVDGKLTDELNKYIKNNLSNFYKIVRNTENKGLAFTLNRLVEVLEDEEYIFRMDSDDICCPNRVLKQITYMQENSSVLISGGAIEEFDKNGRVAMVRSYPDNTEKAKDYIYKASIFAHPAVCFNKEFFIRGFRYNTTHKFSQDVDLWFLALKNNIEVGNISDIILKLRVNPDFYKRRSYKKAFGEFRIYYKGIIQNYGFGFKLIYPVMRLLARLLPIFIVKFIYKGGVRKFLNQKKDKEGKYRN